MRGEHFVMDGEGQGDPVAPIPAGLSGDADGERLLAVHYQRLLEMALSERNALYNALEIVVRNAGQSGPGFLRHVALTPSEWHQIEGALRLANSRHNGN